MKIKRFKNIGFALCLLLGGLISCEKSYEVPAINVENYGGKSNRTIAQLLRVHTTDLDLVKKNFTITGIVISSDEYNNSSKMLTIQDATRGLNILIDKSYIYNEYKIGQRVFLQCKGLGITDIDG